MITQLVRGAMLATLAGPALACLRFGATERELRELGTIAVPARLEASFPFEQPDFALFAFDRSRDGETVQNQILRMERAVE
jgi:hypothetical protein